MADIRSSADSAVPIPLIPSPLALSPVSPHAHVHVWHRLRCERNSAQAALSPTRIPPRTHTPTPTTASYARCTPTYYDLLSKRSTW